MKQPAIHIPVEIDAAAFRRFALFDTFRRKKLWRRPAVFAAILCVSSALCFSRWPQEGSLLLGGITLGLGLGMPLIWYLSYEHSLRAQAKRMGLAAPRRAYTLTLTDDTLAVSQDNGKSFTDFSWEQVAGVWRRADISYLYLDAGNAYLLPHSQIREGEPAFAALLARCLPAEKIHDAK